MVLTYKSYVKNMCNKSTNSFLAVAISGWFFFLKSLKNIVFENVFVSHT